MEVLDVVNRRFSGEGVARRWSDPYDSETVCLEEHNYRCRRDMAVEWLLPVLRPDSRVLDLGCGAGPTLVALRQRGVACVGADASPDMLRLASDRLRSRGLDDSQLVQADCRATPFPEAHFDAVLCLGVISYLQDYDPVLHEIRRVLRPGGLLILSWRNALNLVVWDPVRWVTAPIRRWRSRPGRNPRPSEAFCPGRFLDSNDVLDRMGRAGFLPGDLVGIGCGPLRLRGRAVLPERWSMGVSEALSRCLPPLGGRRVVRALADVHLGSFTRGTTL